MRTILSGIVVAVVLAALAGIAYSAAQKPAYELQPMPSVRVGDPGNNLVGESWGGNPGRRRPDSQTAPDGAAIRAKSTCARLTTPRFCTGFFDAHRTRANIREAARAQCGSQHQRTHAGSNADVGRSGREHLPGDRRIHRTPECGRRGARREHCQCVCRSKTSARANRPRRGQTATRFRPVRAHREKCVGRWCERNYGSARTRAGASKRCTGVPEGCPIDAACGCRTSGGLDSTCCVTGRSAVCRTPIAPT